MTATLTDILEHDDRDMVVACEKAHLIASALKPYQNQVASRNPTRNATCPSQLHKNPMFRTSFFKKEDLQNIGINNSGKKGGASTETRGSEGALAFFPLLPPRKYELDMSSIDYRSWTLSNFNQLAPFSMEMWKMFASVMDEEIAEYKRKALLANSPTKCVLGKSWAMYFFSPRKYTCEEKAIVRVKMDIVTRLQRDQKHHSKLFN